MGLIGELIHGQDSMVLTATTYKCKPLINNKPTVSYVGGSITLHYLLLEFPATIC